MPLLKKYFAMAAEEQWSSPSDFFVDSQFDDPQF